MSDILCSWVNYDVQLKDRVNRDSLGNQFRSGYLFGEILHRYGYINAEMFGAMHDSKSNEGAIRNFTLLRSVFEELEIKLTPTKIQCIMAKKKDVIREILYELYIALHNKKVQTETKSRKSLAIDKNDVAKLRETVQKETIATLAAKLGHDRQEQKRIQTNREIFDVHSMKPTGAEIEDNLCMTKSKRLTAQEDMIKQISNFEEKLDKIQIQSPEHNLQNSDEYLEQIRTKKQDQVLAEIERQKRRRHVLVREITNLQTQQNYNRDNQLIARLIRETRFEKHLAAHLMAVRREKTVMIENRRQLNEQFEQERLKKFDEYLETLKQNEKQEEESLKEQQQHEMILHEHVMKQRQSRKYEKHWKTCKSALDGILDFAFRFCEYRLLSKNKIPQKMIREWRELFHAGLDIFDDGSDTAKELLNEQDYTEYNSCTGEWKLPPEIVLPQNPVSKRMYQILQQTVRPPPTNTEFSDDQNWPLRIAILGKRFSGKTTLSKMIAKNHDVHIICVQDLVLKAIDASKAGETITVQTAVSKKKPEKSTPSPFSESSGISSEADIEERAGDTDTEGSIATVEIFEMEIVESVQPSARAALGEQAAMVLSQGQQLPDKLVVDIIDEALNHIDGTAGWIIDGYPANENQAKLMESTQIRLQSVISLVVSDKTSIMRSTANESTSDVTVQQELSQYHDAWSKIEGYYGTRTMSIVSDREVDEVYNDLEQAILEIMNSADITEYACASPILDQISAEDKISDMMLKRRASKASNASLRRLSRRGSTIRSKTSALEASENELLCRLTEFVPLLDVDEDNDEMVFETCSTILEIDSELTDSAKNRAIVILSNLRFERETTLRHLANVRDSFYMFLNRPDPRQEYINTWQAEYNNVTFELRRDDEVRCELHQRFLDLREQLWEVSDNRKQEAEKEREKLMMNGWIRDRIHLMVQHYMNLTHVELIQAALIHLTLRLHYLCQGNVLPPTAAHSTGVFTPRKVPDIITELSVNASDSSVSDMADFSEKIDEAFSEQLRMLEEIETAENDLFKQIVYRDPTPPTPPSPAKAAAKAKDKKGKEKTPEPVDPILQGRIDRSELCKVEAMEGARLAIVHARHRIELIKHVLKSSIDEVRDRFSSTFIKMDEMIKISFQSEMNAVDEFETIVRSAIEYAQPLPNQVHLNKSLTLDTGRKSSYKQAAKQKENVPALHPLLDKARQLEKHATNILDVEKAKELAEDLEISREYFKNSNGDWRILLFGAVQMDSTLIFRLRLLKEPIMTYSEWINVTDNESPITELGWQLNKGGTLDSKLLLNLSNI